MPQARSPLALPNFDLSGFDSIVQLGSSLKYASRTGSTPATIPVKDGPYLSTAFKDVSASPIKAKFDTLVFGDDGSISASGTTTMSKPIELPVASLVAGSVKFSFAASSKQPATFTAASPDIVIGPSIPEIATNEDNLITVEAQNLTFDIDGNVTFTQAFFPVQGVAATQAIPSSTIDVSFADPADLDLQLTHADFTMVVTSPNAFKTVEFQGALTLPAAFSSTDPATGAAALVVTQSFDAKVAHRGATTKTAESNEIDAFWNTFQLKIPAGSGALNFKLDFVDRRFDGAAPLLRERIKLAKELDDHGGVHQTYRFLTRLLIGTANRDGLRELAFNRHRYGVAPSVAPLELCWIAHQRGRRDEGRRHFLEALVTLRDEDDSAILARHRNSERLGDGDDCRESLERLEVAFDFVATVSGSAIVLYAMRGGRVRSMLTPLKRRRSFILELVSRSRPAPLETLHEDSICSICFVLEFGDDRFKRLGRPQRAKRQT